MCSTTLVSVCTSVMGYGSLTGSQLTTLPVSHGGECHSDPSWRQPVLFALNTYSGCTTR